ncbi:MAG: SH3 domain-containing protein [Anaerolineales bacterium]|nr:SH3 domain-containing protein [Anaerolineales bacterium]
MNKYEMTRNWFHPIVPLLTALLIFGLYSASSPTEALAQQPTDVPASGMFITVVTDEPQINVRMGPSSYVYPIVGTLITGSTAPALGRSQGGDWIQIEFPGAPDNRGWVYSPLVQVSPGALQIVDAPPTPVQPPTSTVDPTLAAQFNIAPTATRLPTFTPPPSLTLPAYVQPSSKSEDSVPLGVIILAFAVLGLIGLPLSIIRRS